jgi:hypothetical protein
VQETALPRYLASKMTSGTVVAGNGTMPSGKIGNCLVTATLLQRVVRAARKRLRCTWQDAERERAASIELRYNINGSWRRQIERNLSKRR